MANPDIPLCDLASLNWVSHRVPSSPALGLERERTEGRRREKFYNYLDVTHTCSETSYRITEVECISRAQTTQ